MHDICEWKVRDEVPYLPYFESIKSESLRHRMLSESSAESAAADKFHDPKYQKLYSMDFGDQVVMRGQDIDVPRLIYSAFRTGNSSQELEARLIDVYRYIDTITSDIVAQNSETGSGWTWRRVFGNLMAFFV